MLNEITVLNHSTVFFISYNDPFAQINPNYQLLLNETTYCVVKTILLPTLCYFS